MYKIDCIYLMAGKGYRTGLGYPKQFYNLCGKPMFIYGLELLNKCPNIGNIIIINKNSEDIENILVDYNIKNFIFRIGGDTRQESVKCGLDDVITNDVLIMESVRPFVSMELLQKVIDIEGYSAVTPKSKLHATLIDVDGNCYNRDLFGEVQMPQKFTTGLLRQAHNNPVVKNATDDSYIFWETFTFCQPIKVIEGETQNIKITTPQDLIIAEALMKGGKKE